MGSGPRKWTQINQGQLGGSVFWLFWGTDFIMGKNQNAIFSKPFHGRILISWNLILYTFLCTKIKKFTIANFFFSWCMFKSHVCCNSACCHKFYDCLYVYFYVYALRYVHRGEVKESADVCAIISGTRNIYGAVLML